MNYFALHRAILTQSPPFTPQNATTHGPLETSQSTGYVSCPPRNSKLCPSPRVHAHRDHRLLATGFHPPLDVHPLCFAVGLLAYVGLGSWNGRRMLEGSRGKKRDELRATYTPRSASLKPCRRCALIDAICIERNFERSYFFATTIERASGACTCAHAQRSERCGRLSRL